MATPFTLTKLKDEIVNDPEAIGYKNSAVPTDWKGDGAIADLINAKNLVVDRIDAEMEAVRSSTEFDWYNALTADEQEYLSWQTPNGGLWKVTAHMKLLLTGRLLVVNGAATLANNVASFWSVVDRDAAVAAMLAVIEVAGGRAEVLWGQGTNVGLAQVGAAFNLI